METSPKKVSVILPNYNYARFFKNRIAGILEQTYPIYELIVLDDASTDDSIEVIRETLCEVKKTRSDIKLKIALNKKNSGNVFSQWQKGIDFVSGDYFWICELDDLTKPKFLETAMESFETDPAVVLSYTNSLMVNDEGRPDPKANLRRIKNFLREDRPVKSYIRSGKVELEKVLCIYNTIPNVSAVVFKKDPEIDYDAILETAKTFRLSGDWYFYVKILLHGKIAYSKKTLNIHRIHKNSVTEKTDPETHLLEVEKIHHEIAKELDLDSETKRRMKAYEDFLKNSSL